MNFLKWFLSGEAKPLITCCDTVQQMYKKGRFQGLIAMIGGYSFYYVLRMTLGIVKKPLIDEVGLSATELGIIGAGMLVAIAFGKCFNGFIADRCSIKKIVPLGLFLSAIISIIMGFTTSFWAFFALWTLLGWFQSMGSAPCIVSLAQWFSKSELATRYGLFGIAQFSGVGLSFVTAAWIAGQFGWKAAFIIPGILGIGISYIMYKFMYDRPESYGLPNVADFRNDHVEVSAKKEKSKSTKEAQMEVLKNPYVWLIALSAAFVGIARYSINSWGVIFLQEHKAYSLLVAGSILAVTPVLGGLGSIMSGYVSDKYLKSNHALMTVISGLVMLGGLVGFCFNPPGNELMDVIYSGIFGLGLGVVLNFVGGMLAVDLCSAKAAGAAMGVVGLLSYAGAGLQDVINGWLMDSSKIVVNGATVYNFDNIIAFWIGSNILIILLILPTLWAKKVKVEEPITTCQVDSACDSVTPK